MKKSFLKYALGGIQTLFIAGVFAVSTAQAAVITWDYNLTAEFTSSTFTGAGTQNPSSLIWGTSTGSGQSSLVLDTTAASGQVDTFLGAGNIVDFTATGIELTHNNNPITGSSLTDAVLSMSVLLDPFTPDNLALPLMSFDFDIQFAETPNTTGNCAVVSSPTPCNDIFVLVGGFPNFGFSYDAGDGDGVLDYFVNVFITDNNALSILDDATCTAASAALGCFGLTTVESQSNIMPFGFTVSTEPLSVPEPGSLALFGLALMLMRLRFNKLTC